MNIALILSSIAIFVLLALSAFFSASETALTAASRARLHQMAQAGNKRATIVNRLRDHSARLISALLLGNNLVNILASALATSIFITLFGDIGVAYATAIMTALIVVFSEVMPKTIALRRAVPVSLFVGPLLPPIVALFAPAVAIVNFIVGSTLKLLGMGREEADAARVSDAAQDELRGAIELHSEDAGIIRHERQMLDTIMDMDEVELGDIMIHRKNMEMVDCSKPMREIIDQVLGSPYTRLPLWKENTENIIGIIHAKDLLRALLPLNGEYEKVDIEALAAEPWFVPETTTLRNQLNAFLTRKTHFALVVDEYGALMGLVTLEDILEEIVGSIEDEHDLAAIDVRSGKDGSIITRGEVTIRDLNRHFNWSLPDEEAATIAGLIIHEAQIIPDVGQAFIFYGHRFEITKKEHNQITELKITPVEH